MSVTSGSLNFEDTVFDGQQRNIESTTTQVKDQNVLFTFVLLVQTVSNGSGGWFVDDSQNVQTSNGTSILGCLSLGIVEVSWNGNNGIVDLATQVGFSSFLHLGQDHRRDFFWSEDLGFTLVFDLDLWLTRNLDNLEWEVLDITLDFRVREVSTDQTLSVENGVSWVHSSLVLSSITNQSFGVSEGNERWSGSVTLVVGQNFNTIVRKVGNTGVGGTQINTNSLRHICLIY
ncbi:putative uncharacterized protein YAL004W [Kluyveromyces marxianus DMKU3-1042]|uniref:Uncharacterized protein n=1 Tax=Kluyveromyces marxianus (strain DMKU3-1042 / BCC 29191 / NBRC 104275) TaxID=1003335 RepID=W0T7Z6_KLUMD|nr:uncharacterized protein KLMA_20458 [Kluyveromyces marxianus DMKU3-1042]BAO38916.1 putative uncharacterized protein YAL004W [Kluyveromyces marxianus DMKU3-1042]